MAVFDLLRHGEPVGGRRYRGWTDDPLSERGWRQMEAATAGDGPWNRIVTSPLRRCRDFAAALGDRLAIPVREDERLREQGFGSWEGRSPDELRQEDAERLRRFYADPLAHPPEGSEPLHDFLARVGECWRELLERHRGDHVLIVGHAGTARAIISLVLEVPPRSVFRIAMGYAAIARIESDGERPPTLAFERG
jgi:alpha-ribazole phosphatase/probable phosphoglycerate mutase